MNVQTSVDVDVDGSESAQEGDVGDDDGENSWYESVGFSIPATKKSNYDARTFQKEKEEEAVDPIGSEREAAADVLDGVRWSGLRLDRANHCWGPFRRHCRNSSDEECRKVLYYH